MSGDERAALVARGKSMASYTLAHQLADLIEADGKRLAVLDKAVEDAPHDTVSCATWYGPQDARCTCWKAGL